MPFGVSEAGSKGCAKDALFAYGEREERLELGPPCLRGPAFTHAWIPMEPKLERVSPSDKVLLPSCTLSLRRHVHRLVGCGSSCAATTARCRCGANGSRCEARPCTSSDQGTEPPMGTGDGDDPRSPANRGWWWGWTRTPRADPLQIGLSLRLSRGWGLGCQWGWAPDPRQIGGGTPTPDPRQIGDGDGDGE